MKLLVLVLCLIAQLCLSIAHDAHFLSDAYIQKINDEQDLWQAGRNFDPNTPLSDIKILMGAKMEGREDFKKLRSVKTFDPLWPEEKKIPKRFDSRKKWHKKCPKIGQVLDQGRCGSCWAIAAAQAFTDRYCIKTRGRDQLRLSTANVLSCCKTCGYGCSGGWESLAWSYFHTHGLPTGGLWNTTDGCQPYNIQSPCKYSNDSSPYEKCPSSHGTPDCPAKCTNTLYRKNLNNDYRFAEEEYSVEPNEKTIMKEIMTYGPVTAAFNVMSDFPSYKSGVYEPANDANSLGGHAIKLIGWGVEKKVPYWLVMNSWNEYWGDHGLIKMKRGSPKIKLESEVWAGRPIKKKTALEDEEDIPAYDYVADEYEEGISSYDYVVEEDEEETSSNEYVSKEAEDEEE